MASVIFGKLHFDEYSNIREFNFIRVCSYIGQKGGHYFEMMTINNSFHGNVTLKTRNEIPYDHVGAMHFIVAVIVVYSGAVTALFVLRIFSRKLPEKCERDNETDAFLKTMPKIRIILEQEDKMRTVKQIEKLHTVRKHTARKDTAMFGQSIMPLLALPVTLAGNGSSDIHKIDSTASPGQDVGIQITLAGNGSSDINAIDNKASPGQDIGFHTSPEIFVPQDTIKMLENNNNTGSKEINV